jgi:hypothetical protein
MNPALDSDDVVSCMLRRVHRNTRAMPDVLLILLNVFVRVGKAKSSVVKNPRSKYADHCAAL